MPEQFDLIVLGAGTAARDAAGKAIREYAANVAMVERERWGGGCPNVACRPTKAYLVAADLVHDVNELADWMGIETGPARPVLTRLRDWKRSLQRTQDSWRELLESQGITTVLGQATFTDPHTVRVGDRELSADRILVATGSRTAVPPIDGIDEIDWIDHVSALELTEIPASLVVLGGGPVGLEFGQIFARFGSRVTIVNGGPHMTARSDREAAEELQQSLEAEGIELVHESRAAAVRNEGGEVVVTLDPSTREVRGEKLLLASGRRINVEELKLEAAGVEYSPRAIVVDAYLRTTADGIWAAGDVTGIQFTPVAAYQARIAVDDMFATAPFPAEYDYLPTAIFTDPEIADVGLSERDAAQRGIEVDAVVHPLRNVTRSQFTQSVYGLFKVVFDRETRQVVGIHVVSRAASDIVQGLAVALKAGITVDDLARSHHIYPSYGEGVKAAAERALQPATAA
jgi:pyruvate/2-oxoglutarate dehydrogenase complex dihydrolipoamide dehydrogenase (E3) component